MDGWLPAIVSFVFLIVACSSPPFLFSPLPFVCLTLLLSIWPMIDKTQSLTMLGAPHRIGGDGAHALWRACVCVSVRALAGRWDAAHVIVYLPFHFQMALSRKNVLLDTFPPSLSLSSLLPFLHLSCGSLRYMDLVSGPEHTAGGEGEGGERARKADWDLRGSPVKSGGSRVCVCRRSVITCASDCTSETACTFPSLHECL